MGTFLFYFFIHLSRPGKLCREHMSQSHMVCVTVGLHKKTYKMTQKIVIAQNYFGSFFTFRQNAVYKWVIF